MIHKFNSVKYTSKQSAIEAAKNAISRLTEIIDNVDGATTAQIKAGIKDMAIYERHLVRIVAGEL